MAPALGSSEYRPFPTSLSVGNAAKPSASWWKRMDLAVCSQVVRAAALRPVNGRRTWPPTSEPSGAQVSTARCCRRGANGCAPCPIKDQRGSGTGGHGRRRARDQPSEGLAHRLGVPVSFCRHHPLHVADQDRFACAWADRGGSGLSVGNSSVGDLSCIGSDVDVPAVDRRVLPDGYLRPLSDVEDRDLSCLSDGGLSDESVNLGDGKFRRTRRIQQLESLPNFGSGEALRKPAENEMLLRSRDGLRRKLRSVGYGEDANQAVVDRLHHRNQRQVLDRTVSATMNEQKRRTRGASFPAEFAIQMLPKHCGRRNSLF